MERRHDYVALKDLIESGFASMNKRLDVMESRYNKELYGNGRKGLIREVEALKSARDDNRKWDFGAIATGVVSLMAALAAFVKEP